MLLTREKLFPLAFYQKSKFHGSRGIYNYRIEKYRAEEEEKDQFRLTIWEGPECFDASKKEKKSTLYPFSEEGMGEIMDYLNRL